MEIWIPYGEVESLVTLKAENLGETLDTPPESHLDQIAANLLERAKGTEGVLVCDLKPPTVKVVKALAAQSAEMRFVAPAPRRLEAEVPESKERVTQLGPPSARLPGEGRGKASPEVVSPSKRLVLATGEPDPLLGYVDAGVALALAGVEGARRLAFERRAGDEPGPLKDNPSYDALTGLLSGLTGLSYATLVARGGEPYSVIEGGMKEARDNYSSPAIPTAKGAIIGAGGKGHDETLSHSIRHVVGALSAVKKGGEVIIVAECRAGLGSTALENFCSGKVTDGFLKRGSYVEGLEEIYYLIQLRDNYSVTLLSSLPEIYASGKLKFKTARGAGEALDKAFGSIGRAAKLNVVTRASETVLA